MSKHDWAVTDNQGYCMQCIKCGKEIIHPVLTGDFTDEDEWSAEIDADCPGSEAAE
ncbi:MAG: hypothetical protein AB1330_01435 [Bacillota bacterium]